MILKLMIWNLKVKNKYINNKINLLINNKEFNIL